MEVVQSGATESLSGGLQAVREGPWVAVVGAAPEPPLQTPLSLAGVTLFGPWRLEPGAPGQSLPQRDDLVVRPPRSGDRIAMSRGNKKVADVLREGGVPLRLRTRWPVVESGGRIRWVVGLRASPPDGTEPVTSVAARRISQ